MTKAAQARRERLLPGGCPRYVRCYDNGGPDKEAGSIDRYTVVFTNQKDGWCRYLGMSGSPFHPQGVGQHGEADHLIDRPSYHHLGRKIGFLKLPQDCRKLVLADYMELWNLVLEEGM